MLTLSKAAQSHNVSEHYLLKRLLEIGQYPIVLNYGILMIKEEYLDLIFNRATCVH